MTRPMPHTNYVPLLPLTKELYNGLFDIYNRAKTNTCMFYVEGFENSETLWTETEEEHQWIIDNILPHYGLTLDDLQELVYVKEDKENEEASNNRDDTDRSKWSFTNVPPWGPRSLNFTRTSAISFIDHHTDPEGGCKINIPVLNIRAADIYFTDSDERCFYPTTTLFNVRLPHSVNNLENMGQYTPPFRVFFQIVLKESFDHWKEILPLPYGF